MHRLAARKPPRNTSQGRVPATTASNQIDQQLGHLVRRLRPVARHATGIPAQSSRYPVEQELPERPQDRPKQVLQGRAGSPRSKALRRCPELAPLGLEALREELSSLVAIARREPIPTATSAARTIDCAVRDPAASPRRGLARRGGTRGQALRADRGRLCPFSERGVLEDEGREVRHHAAVHDDSEAAGRAVAGVRSGLHSNASGIAVRRHHRLARPALRSAAA